MPAHMTELRIGCAHIFVIFLWLGCVCGVCRMDVGTKASHHRHMYHLAYHTCLDSISRVLCMIRSSVRPQWMASLSPARAASG